MKRIRKNKIKYLIIFVILFVFFCYFSGLLTSMRYWFSVQLKIDMDGKVTEITYDLTYILYNNQTVVNVDLNNKFLKNRIKNLIR